MLTYLDFFSGAGGWSCGLNQAGLTPLGLYDRDPSACKTAQWNLGNAIFCVDLLEFSRQSNPLCADLVVGSPPCQGFSNEGKKQAQDPRNSLVWIFFDIIEQLSPKVWIFENVPGFKRLYEGKFYEALKQRLNTMPYYWSDFLLDASHYGVPQNRKRFFVMGAKDFTPEPPPATHSEYGEVLGTEPAITLWEAISDLPEVGIGEKVGIFDYDREPESGYQEWMRQNNQKIHNHTTQKHSARVLEKIRSVPMGKGMEAFIGRYRENLVAYCGGYRRAVKNRPSYTAYWTRGMTSIHPEQHRFLSPRECARIQSFPDGFYFQGTTIENYTQICNAVPPLVARAFGRYLLNLLHGKDIPAIPWQSDNLRQSIAPNFPLQLRLPL